MEKVKLRQTAIVDLNVTFARSLGGNKIRHYKIPSSSLMVLNSLSDNNLQKSAFELVQEYILKNEGLESELVPLFDEQKTVKYTNNGPLLQVEDVTKEVLQGQREIKKALLKHTGKSLIYEYAEFTNFFDRLKAFYNRKTRILRFIFPWINYKYEHKFVPCSFLTVAYEPKDRERAFEALRQDLKTLYDKDLILGHLAMPSIIKLADIVGAGNAPEAVFCFLYVKSLVSTLGKENKPESPLSEFGVKYSSSEGGINFLDGKNFKDLYEIEEVVISSVEGKILDCYASDKVRELSIESYNEARETVLEAAAAQKAQLDSLGEKVSNTTIQAGPLGNFVHVDVSFKEKE